MKSIQSLASIIVVSMRDILDNIYKILCRPPICQSSLSFVAPPEDFRSDVNRLKIYRSEAYRAGID
jgi:hypothetical protein